MPRLKPFGSGPVVRLWRVVAPADETVVKVTVAGIGIGPVSEGATVTGVP